MSVKIIQDRLDDYGCRTEQEEENAIKEIVQEVCLSGLSRSGFFKEAAFQGGTCLRILHGLARFSEDLDFILKTPDPRFTMGHHLEHLQEELRSYGFDFQIQDRSRTDAAVKKAFLKDESWGKTLVFSHTTPMRRTPKKIAIKIEVDTNPPGESGFEDRVLAFPFPFSVVCQDLPSLFAGKSHALLCRPYVKGRDWYDFLWYARKKVKPNFSFLRNAIAQTARRPGEEHEVGPNWYRRRMEEKIGEIDWNQARRDVARFLRPQEVPSLELWSKEFFVSQLEQIPL